MARVAEATSALSSIFRNALSVGSLIASSESGAKLGLLVRDDLTVARESSNRHAPSGGSRIAEVSITGR